MQLRGGSAVAHMRAVLVGYVLGAGGGVMVADAFLAAFCVDYAKSSPAMCRATVAQLPPAWLAFVARFNAALFVGGSVGAAAGAWLAELRGRRVASAVGALLVTGGSLGVALAPARAHSPLLLARALQGVGAGGLSLSLLLWSAEVGASAAARAALLRRALAMVAAGVLLANVANAALENVTHGWRYAIALAAVPAVLLALASCCCLPESPHWLLKTRGREAARAALQAQRSTTDVDDALEALSEQLGSVRWRELWAARPLRRRFLVVAALQLLQHATGISVVLTYGGLLFEGVAGDGVASLVVVATVNMGSAILATRYLDALGRRQALLLGAAGMSAGHLVSAVAAAAGCTAAACSPPAGFTAVSSTAFVAFCFAASWGPECWVHSTELIPVATALNWAAGALATGVTPEVFPFLGVSGVFFAFAALSAVGGVFVAWTCPEVAPEDAELLVARASAAASDESLLVLSPPAAAKYDEVGTPASASVSV